MVELLKSCASCKNYVSWSGHHDTKSRMVCNRLPIVTFQWGYPPLTGYLCPPPEYVCPLWVDKDAKDGPRTAWDRLNEVE